ncbi:hypothetical protein D3C72_1572810 [compost metagenome]
MAIPNQNFSLPSQDSPKNLAHHHRQLDSLASIQTLPSRISASIELAPQVSHGIYPFELAHHLPKYSQHPILEYRAGTLHSSHSKDLGMLENSY